MTSKTDFKILGVPLRDKLLRVGLSGVPLSLQHPRFAAVAANALLQSLTQLKKESVVGVNDFVSL